MAATSTALIGRFRGTTWANAFDNPQNLDIIQVFHQGNIVYQLTYAGVAKTSAFASTSSLPAILGRFAGTSFAAAFDNPQALDIIQTINAGSGAIEKYIDHAGTSH